MRTFRTGQASQAAILPNKITSRIEAIKKQGTKLGSVLAPTKRTLMSNNWTDVSAPLVRESGDEIIDPAIMEGKKEEEGDGEGSSYYSEGEESEWEEEEQEQEQMAD